MQSEEEAFEKVKKVITEDRFTGSDTGGRGGFIFSSAASLFSLSSSSPLSSRGLPAHLLPPPPHTPASVLQLSLTLRLCAVNPVLVLF